MTTTRKLFRAIALGALSSLTISAAPVSLEDAQTVALNWMNQTTGKNHTIANQTNMLKSTLNSYDQSVANRVFHSSTYRIIMLEPKGWVIVSSDDIAKPIIAYGESKIDPEHLPPQFITWMDDVDSQIKSGIKYVKRMAASSRLMSTEKNFFSQWKELKQKPIAYTTPQKDSSEHIFLESYQTLQSTNNTYIVKPLLWVGGNSEDDGINWDQGEGYNNKTPKDEFSVTGNGHVPVGCVATAMGQAMRYYGYKTGEYLKGKGEHSYTYEGTNLSWPYGCQCANFGNTTYNWDLMPKKIDPDSSSKEEQDAVSTLLYHVGVSINMYYASSGSGAYYVCKNGAASALREYFNYPNAVALFKKEYSADTWERLIITSLEHGDPVLYGGTDSNGDNGHSFVLDGYSTQDDDTYYHFNWGYSGVANGNFTLGDITPDYEGEEIGDFSYDQRAVFMKGTYDIEKDGSWERPADFCQKYEIPAIPECQCDSNSDSSSGTPISPLLILIFPLLALMLVHRRERVS